MNPNVVATNSLTSDLKTPKAVPEAPPEAHLGQPIASLVSGTPKALEAHAPWTEVKQYPNGATLYIQKDYTLLKVPTPSGERVYVAGREQKVSSARITDGGTTLEFGDANVDGKMDSFKAQGRKLGVTRDNFANLVAEDQFELAPGSDVGNVTLRDTDLDGKFDTAELSAQGADPVGWKRKP
jgi:hypothetical protein